MTKPERETYRRQLLDLGTRLKGSVSKLANEAFRQTGGEASGNLSHLPLHPADLGSDSFEQEVAVGLLENEESQLEEIAAALQRVEGETFGRCEECGKEIGKERLQAVPYARFCIKCARKS